MAARENTTFDEDKKLLMCIILNNGFNVMEECKKAAARMGPGVNAETLRQRFYKLKRDADALLAKPADTTGDDTTTTPTATPVKKGTATPVKKATTAATPKKSTGKGRKRKTDDNDDKSDAEVTITPSKKNKTIKSTTEVAEDDIAADSEAE